MMVNEARKWVGTKFALYGRKNHSFNDKGGCDCIGLILGICDNLKINSKLGEPLSLFDHFEYDMRNSNSLIEKFLNTHFYLNDKIDEGNIALFQINSNMQHVGIIVDYNQDYLGLIHADLSSRKVVEHYLNNEWQQKIIQTYTHCR